MTITTGQTVRITYNGQTVDAQVLIASPNGASLFLSFDAGLVTPDGGMFFGSMPVLRDADGVYRDLLTNAGPVTVEPNESP